MNRFFGFVKKEFLHIFRDPRTMLILFGIPIIQMLLFGFVITNDIKDVKIAVYDLAKDKDSRNITNKLRSSGYFKIVRNIESPDELTETFKKGEVKEIVVFEQHFSKKLYNVLCKFNPDIVHTQSPFFLGIVGMKWANQIGVPVVSTNHTLYTEYCHYLPFVPEFVTRIALIKWMRYYYNRCQAIAVPSYPVEKVLRGYGVRTKIEVIKTGISLGAVADRVEVRRTFDIPEDAFLLLYVGRIAKEKNLDLLLNAFDIIKRNHSQTRLMLVGGGPYGQVSARKAQELGLRDSIHFLGMLDRSVAAKTYAAADVFVFPSITETQGLVICEALASGLPCVAVRAAGTPEVIEDGVDGILTENDPNDFAAAVSRLIVDHELRRRLSEAGRRNSQRFTPEAMAERFLHFYQSAIDNKLKGK